MRASIAELADALHGLDNTWKALALLVAYLDESGTHKGSRITAVSGFVGTKDTWAEIENSWKEALADFEVPAFHSVDCEQGEGDFSRMDIALRVALVNRLARLIGRQKGRLLPVWSAVFNDGWEKVQRIGRFGEAHPKPFHLCFRYVAQRLSDWSARQAGGSQIALVYAEQSEFERSVLDLYSAYRDTRREGRFVSLTIASPRVYVPLQAADLLAYEMNWDWTELEYGANRETLTSRYRTPLKFIRDGLGVLAGGGYDEDAIRLHMRRFNETGDL